MQHGYVHQTPPCPRCSAALRWFPDLQQWGCDRCRVMYPPQQTHQDGAHEAAAATRPKRRKLKIALAIGITMIAASVGIGIAATGSRSSFAAPRAAAAAAAARPSGRDAAVRATFASLAAGDLDELMQNAGLTTFTRYVECDAEHQPSPASEAKDLAEIREEFARAIGREKSAEHEILAIAATEPPQVHATGEVMRGCKLKTSLTSHKLDVTLNITLDRNTENAQASMTVVEIDGHWHVMTAPKIAGCRTGVARFALVGGRDAQDPELANRLQQPMISNCRATTWSTDVIDCTSKALGLRDVLVCFEQLTTSQQEALRAAMAPQLTGSSTAASLLRNVVPYKSTAAASDDGSGKPEPLDIGDMWLRPLARGTFSVRSPSFEVVFPHRPTAKVVPSTTKTADGKSFDIFKISDELEAGGFLQLDVISLGRNMKPIDDNPLRARMAQIGAVKESRHKDGSIDVVRLEVATRSAGMIMIADTHADFGLGLIVAAAAVTPAQDRAVAESFLASVHLRDDARTADAKALKSVRVRKTGDKFVARDATDSFTLELPWPAKVEHARDKASVKITATQGNASVEVEILEITSSEGLAYGPTKLAELAAATQTLFEKNGTPMTLRTTTIAGVPAIAADATGDSTPPVQFRALWNRHQHRVFSFACFEAPCDAIASSLRFAEPQPVI